MNAQNTPITTFISSTDTGLSNHFALIGCEKITLLYKEKPTNKLNISYQVQIIRTKQAQEVQATTTQN
jgi:hypothetical protein